MACRPRSLLLLGALLLGGVQAAIVQGSLQLNSTLEIDAFAELTSANVRRVGKSFLKLLKAYTQFPTDHPEAAHHQQGYLPLRGRWAGRVCAEHNEQKADFPGAFQWNLHHATSSSLSLRFDRPTPSTSRRFRRR